MKNHLQTTQPSQKERTKTPYTNYLIPPRACYELHDPLDPWTEAAIEDTINIVYVDDIYQDQCALLKPNITTILKQRPAYKYDGEYYTLDEFAFYDGFGFKFKRLIIPLIIISWIVLGCFWIGSALNEAYLYLKRRFKKKPTVNPLEACHRPAPIEGQKEEQKRKSVNRE